MERFIRNHFVAFIFTAILIASMSTMWMIDFNNNRIDREIFGGGQAAVPAHSASLTRLEQKETDWVLLSDFESIGSTSLLVATANKKGFKSGERVVFLDPSGWTGLKIPSKGDGISVAWVKVRSCGDAGFVSPSLTGNMFFVVQ